MMRPSFALVYASMIIALLSACRPAQPTAVATYTPTAPATAVSQSTPAVTSTEMAVRPTQPSPEASSPTPLPPTATPVPPKALTVCLAQRPANLYLYGEQSRTATGLRHALYENLYTTLGYDYQAQGLVELPHPDKGSVTVEAVTVWFGESVVDFRGEVHLLREGLTVFDSQGQLLTVSEQPVMMSQMSVEFTLQPMVWSDGVPVSAADSLFSFQLNADPNTPGDKRRVRQTAVYEATGDLTLRWTGLPGYLPGDYIAHVWQPLPQHQLGGYSAAELRHLPESNWPTLSSGPFVLAAITEEGLTLTRNPFYYRASEGLPALDILYVRFVTDGAALLAQELAGCDVVTQDLLSFTQLPQLAEIAGVTTAVVPSAAYEHLDFSVNFYLAQGFQNFVRPDWFQDARVRRGIAHCIDRQRMVDEIFAGQTAVMPAYIPAEHPLYPPDLLQWEYDPTAGRALLDAAGYRDSNGDGVREDPLSGQPFRVRLTTDNANPVRAQTAAIIQENLAACGIAVTPEFLLPEDWYSDGPLGALFGRRFELALFAWLGGPQPACHLWLERNITGPTQEGFGGWGNINVSGWALAEFETACNAALNAPFGTAVYAEAHQQALRIWAEHLPMLPLFSYPRVTAARTHVRGLQPDATQTSELWNIFAWDIE